MNLYAFCANNPVMYVDPSGYTASKCEKKGKDEKIENSWAGALGANKTVTVNVDVIL